MRLRRLSSELACAAVLCGWLGTGHAAPIPAQLKPIQVLNRLAFGPRPGEIDRVSQMGVEAYIDQQLHPENIPLPESLKSDLGGLDTLGMNPIELFRAYRPPIGKKVDPEAFKAARLRARIIVQQTTRARLERAILSPRQLQEVMVDFWYNHFNVFAGKGLDYLWVGAYEDEAIRPYALGRFRDLLGATARHPAMLFYLDNWLNTGLGTPGAKGKSQGLNENYARELMELHTLGVGGGYTQQDVTALARILTGWGLPPRGQARRFQPGGPTAYMQQIMASDGFYFDASRHDYGDKVFLGHLIKGSGMAEGEQALDILARSPATAHHLAFELAQYFVADTPPPMLVERLSRRYLASDGDIRAVLSELFHSPEFWDQQYYGAKFKTPFQFVVSEIRATGIEPRNYRPLAGQLFLLGMPLYGCQTPDGYKNVAEVWLNPDAMMRRVSFATALGSGRLPLMHPPLNESDNALAYNANADGGKPGIKEDPMMMPPLGAPQPALAAPHPLDPYELAATLGNHFSHQTAAAVQNSPQQLRAALILGSPEFMHH